MSQFSAGVSNKAKIRLLALMMGMEIYTLAASTIGMVTSTSLVFVANFAIAFTGALASGLMPLSSCFWNLIQKQKWQPSMICCAVWNHN